MNDKHQAAISTQTSQEKDSKAKVDQQPSQNLMFESQRPGKASLKRPYSEISRDSKPDAEEENRGKLEEEKGKPSLLDESKLEPLTCHICTEEIKEKKAIIDCGHIFCTECIQKWSEIESKCPYCKQEFTQIRIRLIRKMPSKRKPRLMQKRTIDLAKKKTENEFSKLKIVSPVKQKTVIEVESNEDSLSVIMPSEFEQSEDINVINVQKKKQRVNENYIDVDSDLDDDDDSYYDDDYDSESEGAQFIDIFTLINHSGEAVTQFVNSLCNHMVQVLSFQSLNSFTFSTLRARIISWEDVMVIPERMREQLQVVTSNRVTRIPQLQRQLIIKYCLNNPETYNLELPFIAEEDLALESSQQFYVHVINPRANQEIHFEMPQPVRPAVQQPGQQPEQPRANDQRQIDRIPQPNFDDVQSQEEISSEEIFHPHIIDDESEVIEAYDVEDQDYEPEIQSEEVDEDESSYSP